jgi:prepilin-type N-terminal cleavage/methylation domain-containing protein
VRGQSCEEPKTEVQGKTSQQEFKQIEGGSSQKMNLFNLRSLRKRLPKNNQKGFTLIELLVVISILGILAAVVTMSLVGITKVAQTRAGDTETRTVQVAMDTMLADMGVDADAACTGAPGQGSATNDMSKFPSSAAWSSSPTHATVSLYPHYLRENKTHGTYYCQNLGETIQSAFTP